MKLCKSICALKIARFKLKTEKLKKKKLKAANLKNCPRFINCYLDDHNVQHQTKTESTNGSFSEKTKLSQQLFFLFF